MIQDGITTAAHGKGQALAGSLAVGPVDSVIFLAGFALGALALPLFHAVLSRAVQRLSKASVTQPASIEPIAKPLGVTGCLGPSIRAAIRAGELKLHYQPKLDCRTGRISGAEALSRWTLPDGTSLPPHEFVAQAEVVGGISELTVWTVEQALQDSQSLESGKLGGPIFINLSGKLVTAQFTERLIALAGSDAGRLGLEITETAVLENPEEALDCLFALRDAGIALAIDDYGAGLSSLSYLKQIPAEELKIDQKFIRGITRSHRDPMIVRSTIDLCHGLGMKVTAEGVEDQMTASLLGVMGCDMIQGYFISRARPMEGLLELIEQQPNLALQVPKIRKRVGN